MTTTALEPHTLHTLVRELADAGDFWKPHVAYQSPRRYWTKLITRPDLDVWLLTWLHEQGTQVHDHGHSQAAFAVVAGELTEVRPSAFGRGFIRQKLRTGDSATVEPYAIHDVVNTATSPAISIHAYSPPLRSMTFYERASDGLVPTYREEIIDGVRP